jgi:3-hydroxybutyryl-CoA dehydratase
VDSFYVAVGDKVTFSKTVSESDVYLFAGITGDLAPNHVDEEYMKRSGYGRRIAHGALVVGFMSTASSMAIANSRSSSEETPVSLGYDRIRFLAPVYFGDTVTVQYEIVAIDEQRRRSVADMRVINQSAELVAVGQHILKWVANRP